MVKTKIHFLCFSKSRVGNHGLGHQIFINFIIFHKNNQKVSLFSKLQHSFTSKDRSILKIIFNRKYFNRCILKRFWEIWFVFFREKHKLHHFFTTVTRCDLGKNMVFPFWKCEFSVSEALLNWKIFFENEDTKGIWGEIIVDFHF